MLRIALAARLVDAKIMLGVLIEIFGGYSIAARRRFACQGDVSLEDLPGGATDPDLGAAAVKRLIGLRNSWLRSERLVGVKAAARPLIRS